MKIQTDDYGKVQEWQSLMEYAELKLDGDDYGKGRLEAAEDTARNNSKAIGRLLDLMADKGIVSANEVVIIIEGFISSDAVFKR